MRKTKGQIMTYDEITYERSKTHLGWQDCGQDGIYEILLCGDEIVRAHRTVCLDVQGECRPGRFVCYAGHAKRYGMNRCIGAGYMPGPNGQSSDQPQ